ncbi:SWI/SNF complex subunit SWI3C [Vitis vinifera]|uniref:SWI/SNF complex subunit SWI3C n=1 Tax=Vitis vinifera TaxID=29760 RepID=A0A438K3U4_VITVI|nr:SWI/SNF complex subunit SWI3C [Vitis vinifera]
MTPSSDARTKWRKRKRDPHVSRRQKHEEDEEDDDDVDDELDADADDDNEQQPQHGPQSGAVPDPAPLMREVLSDGAVRISDFPSVVKHTVNRPHSSVLAIVGTERAIQFGDTRNQQSPMFLENISHGQLQALSAVPADSPSLATSDQERSDGGGYVVAPPQIMEGRGVIKRFWNGRVHAVPMHSDWFSPNTVHRLERQVVPHFFSGKSPDHTAELYMECRNLIVAKYMEDPEKRLSVFDCKGLVAGIQEEDLTRIVRFLDHWGIINYCASSVPNREPWSSTSYLREDSNGEVHVPSAALKSIDSLIKFDKPKCRLKAAEVYSSLSCNGDEDSDLDCKIRERLSDNRCNYCSRPLPIGYYQSQKEDRGAEFVSPIGSVEADGKQCNKVILLRGWSIILAEKLHHLDVVSSFEARLLPFTVMSKLGLRRFRVERNSWCAVWLGGGLSVQIQDRFDAKKVLSRGLRRFIEKVLHLDRWASKLWWKVSPWISQVVSKGMTSGLKSRTIGRATTDVLEKVLAKELGGNDDSGRPIGSDRGCLDVVCFKDPQGEIVFGREGMGFVAWAGFGWAKRFGWSLGLWMGPSMLVECLLFPSADSFVVGKPLPAPSTSANRYQLPRCWQTVTDSLVVSKQLLAPSLLTNRYRLPRRRQTVTDVLVVGKPLSTH